MKFIGLCTQKIQTNTRDRTNGEMSGLTRLIHEAGQDRDIEEQS